MTITKVVTRNAGIVLAVGLLIAAAAFLLPSLGMSNSRGEPRGAAEGDGVVRTTISDDLSAKLDYNNLKFTPDLAAGDVAVSQDDAIKAATAEFGAVAKGLPATIATVGTFTNPVYGKTLEDGSTAPYIDDRPTWMVVFENVPQTNKDRLGGSILGSQKEEEFTAYGELAVFVDARTGEVLGATTLLTPEVQPDTEATK